MATGGQSEIRLILSGNSEGATQALTEVGKAISDMAENITKVSRMFTDVGKAMTDMVSTVGRDAAAANKGIDSMSKTAGDVSKSISGLSKQISEQTRSMDLSFETVAKTVQDSGISIVSEIDSVNRTISDMASVLTRTTVLMNKQLQGLRQEFKSLASTVKDTSNQTAEANDKLSKSLDYAGMLVAGEQLKQIGEHVVGFFAESVKAASEFDQAMANTRAALDAQPQAIKVTNEQMQIMQDLALKIGASGFYSANQVGEAMSTLARNGLKFNAITQGAIQQTANVAAANQQDIDETAMTVSDIFNELGSSIVKQFGGNVTKAFGYIGDVMTQTLHASKISMTDLFTTMKYAGSVASNAGMSFADLGGAIALLGSHAIRGSTAGTALRRMLTNLTPQSKAAAQMMQQLGMITANGSNIFYDATGHLKSMTQIQELLHDKLSKLSPAMQTFALKTIFGQYALNGMSIIANESPAAFAKLEASMNQTGATMKALSDRETGWQYTFMRMKAEFGTLQKEIGLMLKPVVDALTNSLIGLMNWWDRLGEGTKKTVIIITGVVGVFTLLGGVLFTTIASIGFLVQGFDAAIPVFAAMGGGISKLVGGLVSFATETIPNVIKGLLGMTAAEEGAGVAANAMFGVWGLVIAGIIAGVTLLITHWNQVTQWVKQNFGIDIPQILHQLLQIFSEVWNGIKSAFDAAWNYIKPTLMSGMTALGNFWKSIWPELKQIFSEVWNAMKVVISAYAIPMFLLIKTELGALEASWKYIWAAIGSALKLVWDDMKMNVQIAWNLLSGVIKIGLDILSGNWSKAWTDLKTMVINIWNAIKNGVGNIANDLKGVVMNAINGLISGVMGAFNGLVSGVESVWNKITSIFSQPVPTPSVSTGGMKIPAHAAGGWVTKPELALIAENEPELIIPQSKMADPNYLSQFAVSSPAVLRPGRGIGTGSGSGDVHFHQGAIVINVQNGDANSISRALKTQLQRALVR